MSCWIPRYITQRSEHAVLNIGRCLGHLLSSEQTGIIKRIIQRDSAGRRLLAR